MTERREEERRSGLCGRTKPKSTARNGCATGGGAGVKFRLGILIGCAHI
jgi:hypothetical protein